MLLYGTVSYGAREIARNRNDVDKRSKLFWEIEGLSVITSLISIILWTVFIGFSGYYKTFYMILTLNLFNTMLDISWLYTGMEEFKFIISKNIFFKILGIILLFMFVKSENDLILYIVINVISSLLGTITMWMYLPKFVKRIKLKELEPFKHLKETFVYFIPTVATSIYNVLDKTLLGRIVRNESENGYYEQASKVINMMKSLTFTALNTVLGARISYLYADKAFEEIHKKIDLSLNYILTIGCALMFGIIAIVDNFVPIFYGDGFDKVKYLLIIMSPLILIIGISNCLGSQYYTPSGRRKQSSKYLIIGAMINLCLNLLIIPKYKSLGAALATVIAELVIAILYIKGAKKIVSIKKIIKFGYKKLIAGAIMFVCLYLSNAFEINILGKLILQIVLGAGVYFLVMILLKDTFVLMIIKDVIFSKISCIASKNNGGENGKI